MPGAAPLHSMAAAASLIGDRSARHLEIVFRRLLRGPAVVRDERFVRVITGAAHPFGNCAVMARLDDLDAVRDAIGPLRSCGAPSLVLFPGTAVDPALEAQLAEQGFGKHEPMPAMAVDIDVLLDTALPAGCAFSRFAPGDAAAEWEECLAAGYELPRRVAELFAPTTIEFDPAPDAPVQFFAIHREGRLVTTSMLCLADGLAGIYCVATRPEERGRGLGGHATAEPLRVARGLGYGVGVLQSSPAGHAVYRRLGFADVGGVAMFVSA